MADVSTGTDWGAALDGAAQTLGKPLANTPAAFANYYGSLADKVSANTGIDSNTLLGQWGLETGWGKSVIPGTNNLGNIKVAKGQTGVSATDNQTGSSDQYQKFDTPDAFGDAYTSLLQNRYKGALNTGVDAHATATALKAGGYAEDPDYVSKLTNAASTVAQARGQAPNLNAPQSGSTDWGSLLDSVIPSANASGYQSMSDFAKQYPGPAPDSDVNPVKAFGAGVGRGVQETALGLQSLAGRGASAVGANTVGNWLQNDAQQGNAQGQKDFQSAAGNSLSGKAGEIVGQVVPALAVPAEIGPMAIAGGVQNAGNASLNNQPIAPAFVEGAGLGAGGAAAGQLLGAGYQAGKQAITKSLNGLKGGEDAAAANIANVLGDNVDTAITNLRANADSPIAGVQRTAAEAADLPEVVRLQRAAQNTEQGQVDFPARFAQNNDARIQAGQNAVGPSANNSQLMGPGLEQEAQAFTQTQGQRVAQGQKELPPLGDGIPASGTYSDGTPWNANYGTIKNNDGSYTITRDMGDGQQYLGVDGLWAKGKPSKVRLSGATQVAGPESFATEAEALGAIGDDAAGMNGVLRTGAPNTQTPAFARAINQARTDAANSGINAFSEQSAGINRGLSDAIDQVAGTPETLEAARAARRAQGKVDYEPVQGPVAADTPAFRDLEARPGFNQALRQASNISDNIGGSAAPDVFTRGQPGRQLVMGNDGTLSWVETPAPRFADASVLQGARSKLSNMAIEAQRAGYGSEAQGFRETLGALDDFLSNPDHVGPDISNAFTTAKANYAANSIPVDQQAFLQQRLASAVNNLTGEVNPGMLNSTINTVAKDQLKPGLRPADRITPEQTAALQDIGQQAQRAPTNMTGLNGQGQEVLRNALSERATKDAASAQAHEAFNNYLAQQSPAYKAFLDAQTGRGADLASRQELAGILDKLQASAHNASGVPQINYSTARGAFGRAENLQGQQQEFANSLLQDLQRETTARAQLGAAGSPTSANEALKGGSGLLGDLIGKGTQHATMGAAIATGHFGEAILTAVGSKLLKGANVKTEKAAIDLLLNPKKLADALEKFKNQPSAGQEFIKALKFKASKGGKAGIAAVQTYEATH